MPNKKTLERRMWYLFAYLWHSKMTTVDKRRQKSKQNETLKSSYWDVTGKAATRKTSIPYGHLFTSQLFCFRSTSLPMARETAAVSPSAWALLSQVKTRRSSWFPSADFLSLVPVAVRRMRQQMEELPLVLAPTFKSTNISF